MPNDITPSEFKPCPTCGSHDIKESIEYEHGHPGHYDGVSEWLCVCGTRYGRWTGRKLEGDDYERRYGREEKKS